MTNNPFFLGVEGLRNIGLGRLEIGKVERWEGGGEYWTGKVMEPKKVTGSER